MPIVPTPIEAGVTMQSSTLWLALALMSAITVLLRALPLLMQRKTLRSAWMSALNQSLPLCVMVILVVHSLGPTNSAARWLAEALALLAIAASYLRWRNALVSVVIGLAVLALELQGLRYF